MTTLMTTASNVQKLPGSATMFSQKVSGQMAPV